jgi:glycerol-3-phosphate dehydrogenase
MQNQKAALPRVAIFGSGAMGSAMALTATGSGCHSENLFAQRRGMT